MSWALNLAIPTLPCGFLLFSLLVGVAGLAVNFFTRVIVFVVESNFAKRAGGYALKLNTGDIETSEVSSQHSGYTMTTWVHAKKLSSLMAIARLVFGFSTLEEVSMASVVGVKNSYGIIAIIAILPAAIPVIVLLIA